MSKMIERVAKALAVADGMHADAVSNDEDQVPVWTLYVADARAAIEAMREPTDSMENAGNAGLSRNGLDSVEGDDSTSAWQAMIDAALAEPQP